MEHVARLAALSVEALDRLLRRRPDVLIGRAPRTLQELAQRLDSSSSVTHACRGLTAPELQVVVATAALGSEVAFERVHALLGGDPRPQVRTLADLDLLTFDGSTMRVEAEVRRAVPDLLGLGPPFADLAVVFPHRTLIRVEQAFGLPPGESKRASVERLHEVFADPDRIRRHAARLPDTAITDLLDRAAGHADDSRDSYGYDGYWQHDELVDRLGLQTGLMLGERPGRGGDVMMPVEVALALRGPDYRMRFDPEPPAVARLPVSRVDSDSAAAVAGFDGAATAVLDQVATTPVPTVQAGGVGRRELQRLARATSQDLATVLLVLEVAAEAGLVDDLGSHVAVTGGFRAWRDAEPAARYVVLAAAWWAFPGRPGQERDAHGAARRALAAERCHDCGFSRVALVAALRHDTGLSVADGRQLAGWYRPTAHVGDDIVAGHWDEAVRLGVVAQGAVTSLGVALVARDPEALHDAATKALPASSTEAVFGSDLTVFVAGSPSARISRVLDACATRESGGGAVTWRLSTASVRSALDAGTPLDDLRTSLHEIAAGGRMPASVEVLLDDVGRVYGRSEVRGASGVVVSDDEALLVQMIHDRKLAKLGLEQIAPTVLVAAADPRTTTAALRAAGYLPAWHDDTVAFDPSLAPASWRRSAAPVDRSPTVDPSALARRLLAGADEPVVAASPIEEVVRLFNRQLTDDETAVLAAAVVQQERVRIVYESMTGGITERVIRPTGMLEGRIWAWCELRRDDRQFDLDRVLGVRTV